MSDEIEALRLGGREDGCVKGNCPENTDEREEEVAAALSGCKALVFEKIACKEE